VRIGAQVDPTSGLVAATAAPDELDPPLPPGLAIRGELETRVLSGAALVPERAVLRAGDEQVVALCNDGRAHRVRSASPADTAGWRRSRARSTPATA
jgi:hypothetical protein